MQSPSMRSRQTPAREKRYMRKSTVVEVVGMGGGRGVVDMDK